MLCLRSIASAVLVLGSPASTPAGAVVGGAGEPTLPPAGSPAVGATPPAPLSAPATTPSPARPADAVSTPLDTGAAPTPGAASLPGDDDAPLGRADSRSAAGPANIAAPLGQVPSSTQETVAPRRIEMIRVEIVFGPVWRIRTAEVIALGSVEFGRLRGFSGTVQGGVIVAPDRSVVGVTDYPIGAGFVYRHRFGQRSLYGSAGLTAGLLVHRAATERGLIHRVDPDLQLPLRLTWTVGKLGFSFALLQGFSTRARTYARRGTEVWHRIPYRIGFAVGIHFDVGVGRTRSRRTNREPKGLP